MRTTRPTPGMRLAEPVVFPLDSRCGRLSRDRLKWKGECCADVLPTLDPLPATAVPVQARLLALSPLERKPNSTLVLP